jgi:hypothetical protein
MLSFLKNHPFAVEAFFKRSIVLTFAIPRQQIQHLIPECLQADLFNDKWAFIAIAMVQTKDLRPKGFPKILGNDFSLIGYRVFVRFTNRTGKNLRGLYILKSETDKPKMKFFGNIFTYYNYTTTDIILTEKNNSIGVRSITSGFAIQIEVPEAENISLPAGSPFTEWKEARRFAGPLPFTFTYNRLKQKVLVIEGVRQKWTPKAVRVINYKVPFIDNLKLSGAKLASAFIIENIPYYWKKGKTEQWKQEENSRVS